MTAPAYNVYLNALVASNKSMEVRTRVFSKSNLDSLLSEHPAAITFSRSGVLDAERLLAVYMKNHALFRPIIQSLPSRTNQTGQIRQAPLCSGQGQVLLMQQPAHTADQA